MKKLLVVLVLLAGGTFAFAQGVTLDEAIKNTAEAFFRSSKLEDDEILSILAIDTGGNKDLSDYIGKRLTVELTDGTREFMVVTGGGVPPTIIITGKISLVDNVYEMTISGTNAITNESLVQRITFIKKNDKKIAGFDDFWRTRLFYAGVRGGLAMHIFDISRAGGTFNKGAANPNFGFNAAGEFAYQFKSWDRASLSTQLELIFTMGNMNWEYKNDWQKISYTNVLIPLLFKPNFYIDNWYFSPFLGACLNMSWGNYEFFEQGSDIKGNGDVTFDVKGGAVIGGDIGIKAGPGIVFLDLRYLIDLGRTRPNTITGGSMIYGQKEGDTVYLQQMVMASVGYKIGFGGKK